MEAILVFVRLIAMNLLRMFLMVMAVMQCGWIFFIVKMFLGFCTGFVFAVIVSLMAVAGIHLHPFHMGFFQ
jgi:hypothetical protein